MKERKPQSSWKQDWAPFDTWVKNTVPWRNLPFWGAIFLAARQHFFCQTPREVCERPKPQGSADIKVPALNQRKSQERYSNSWKIIRNLPIPLANDSVLYPTLSLQFSVVFLRLSRLCLSQGQVPLPYVENSLQSRLVCGEVGTRKRTLSPRKA